MNAWIHRTSAFIFLMLFGAVLSPVIAADLTREQAAKILKEKLILPPISTVTFHDFERAEQDGIVKTTIVKSTGFNFPEYVLRNFTSKGLQMVGAVIKEKGTEDTIWTSGLGGSGRRMFSLKDPVEQRINKITGITSGQDPQSRIVEFGTNYSFPSEMKSMAKYIYTGENGEVTLRRYDDGWRVVKCEVVTAGCEWR